jgi:predicted phage baseplate assembly protein
VKDSTLPKDSTLSESDASAAAVNPHEHPPVTVKENRPIPGIVASQLLMLAGVEQSYDPTLPGDKLHTTLVLAGKGLDKNCYKRASLTIYGNVVKATHGETRKEVLGSGDASISMQSFELRQSPLTHVAAPSVVGTESTLEVRVNDLLWHETDSLAWLGPTNRSYITQTDDEDKTKIIFGNGKRGARPPTGVENVKATYRTGIGKPGNVRAWKITSLSTKPLGVKEVTNPLDATGGADREDRDSAQSNAPLAVMALDRLVSVQDYEDFARTFAGIGKARALRLSDGRRRIVFLTIAGADDIPIDETSDLYHSLRQALRKFGDPFQAFQIKLRSLLLLLLSAKVQLNPDYLWEAVEPKIRAALLDRFSFRRRALGQDALLSEAISAIQAVEGVTYVDVDKFDSVGEETTPSRLEHLASRLKLKPRILVRDATIKEEDDDPATRIRAAQLAILSPAVPDTLILTEIKA